MKNKKTYRLYGKYAIKGKCNSCEKIRNTTIGYFGGSVCGECLEKEAQEYYGKKEWEQAKRQK